MSVRNMSTKLQKNMVHLTLYTFNTLHMKNFFLVAFLLIGISSMAQRNPFRNLSEKNGKIGIGTTAPDELLTVKGKIHTQEVIVDLKGAVAPDYVFQHYFDGKSLLDPSYKFLSLHEVDTYIKEHHHLPGVPSAKQLENDGLALKEMNLMLLQKIEELTLYTIEQQKAIKTLQLEVASLKE